MAIGVGLFGKSRRTIRSPQNPLDKCTIVSIYPQRVEEKKCTIQPGLFIIEPAPSIHSTKKDDFSILVVGSSSWWRDIDPEQPLLEIVVGSVQVADSVVKDFCNGLLACNMGDSMPGLFWVPGELDAAEIRKRHAKELAFARLRQNKWYSNLVKMADILWARSSGNPLSISDDMRLAAQELGLKDKPWMKDFSTLEMIACPACGVLTRPGFPVCSACHTIVNTELYQKMGLQKAGEAK